MASFVMADAAPPKKRKLNHDWFVTQINDLDMDEAAKQNVGSVLQQIPEDDLHAASAETLSFYLKGHFERNETTGRIVAGRLHHRIQVLQQPPAPVTAYQDLLCNWLEEAIAKKPKEWAADSVQTFKEDILGKLDMGNKLVVRKCFKHMYDALVKPWLNSCFETGKPFGALVITGTPGIGKSVFLAYVASRLAEDGTKLVIQLGNQWWSRIDGKCICHGYGEANMPGRLLDDPKTVLLGDPVGGKNSQPILPRMRGCTIVFTSPQIKNYDSLWKQYEGRSERYFMPVWAEDEVLKHWKNEGILQDCKKEEDVKMAYSMLGGSVRYLNKLLVAVSKKKTSLEVEAKAMIRDCISNCTFSDLCRSAGSNGANLDTQSNQSKMSRLLHIFSNDNFQEPGIKLIESEIVYSTLRDELAEAQDQALPTLIKASLRISPLGTLCGRLFQMHVLAELTTVKSLSCRALLKAKGKCEADPITVSVPSAKKSLPRMGDLPKSEPLLTFEKSVLYCPESETFPAADYFFVTKKGENITLWLLQITKAMTHDCKIGASFIQFKKYFKKEDVEQVKCIKWIIVAPAEIAEAYKQEQKIENSKEVKVTVEQYVSSWKI